MEVWNKSLIVGCLRAQNKATLFYRLLFRQLGDPGSAPRAWPFIHLIYINIWSCSIGCIYPSIQYIHKKKKSSAHVFSLIKCPQQIKGEKNSCTTVLTAPRENVYIFLDLIRFFICTNRGLKVNQYLGPLAALLHRDAGSQEHIWYDSWSNIMLWSIKMIRPMSHNEMSL